MKYIRSLRGIFAMLCAGDGRFDKITPVMVEFHRLGAKALGQDIVLELIGSVKRLRVSRHSPSTPERSNQFACCKAVVTRNVGNFCEIDTSQRKCRRTSSLCVFSRAIPTASSKTRKGGFLFVFDCHAAAMM